jgi:HlyD family secretion protein
MASSPRHSITTATSSPAPSHGSGDRRGNIAVILMFAGVVAFALVVGWVMMGTDFGSSLLGGGTSDTPSDTQLYEVRRENLRITVTEDGNLESSDNTEVKCEVPGGSTILKIVDEGIRVEEGAELVWLDESTIEDALDQQKGVVDEAQAAKIQAVENSKAAKIAIEEYEKGIFEQEEQIAEANIIIALENQASAENLLDHTNKMVRKGFATPLQLKSDEFAVKRAGLELKAARTALTVLQKYTKKKILTELNAAYDAAVALERSKKAAFDLEQKKRDRLEIKLEKAVIRAPKAGMVIYANERSRYSSVTIELHSAVKEGQSIIRLPDLENMQARVLVNESKIGLLELKAHATLKIGDQELRGKVTSIANQPERASWGSDIKEYAAVVSIEGTADGLKPGMTAEVDILIKEFEDELTIPVSAVVEQNGKWFCWVETASGPERRPLVVLGTNDRKMAISDGVNVGEQVILNPRATIKEARQEEKKSDEDGDKDRQWKDRKPGEEKSDKGSGAGGTQGSAQGGPQGASGKPSGGAPSAGKKPYEDKNGDGLITKNEVSGPMKNYFDKLDENGDGAIDKDEFKKSAERRKAAGGSR